MVKITYIIIKILIKTNKVDELTLTIDGVDIERVNQFNILCFTLISYLNWTKHIDK